MTVNAEETRKPASHTPMISFLGLIAAGAGLCAGCSILPFVMSSFWCFDNLASFRSQYFVLLTVAALILLRRRRKQAIVYAAFAVLNLCLIVPLFFGEGARPAKGAARYRALSMNVYTANRQHESTLAYIRDMQPDFVLVMEVNQRWADELLKLKDAYPYHVVEPEEDNFGIAFFSKHKPESLKIVRLGQVQVASVHAVFDFDGLPLSVIGTHPLPPANSTYFSLRNDQLDQLATYVKDKVSGPILLMGDLNATSWSPYFKRFCENTKLRDSRRGFGVQPSWPSSHPWLWIPIDHCLVSSDITILDRQTGESNGSDHFPIIIDFTPAGAGGHRQAKSRLPSHPSAL